MSHTLNLLPRPQRVAVHTGGVTLPASGVIALAVKRPADPLSTPEARAVLADDHALHDRLEATRAYIDRVTASLSRAEMAVPDAALITREFTLAAQMLRHGAKRWLWQLPGSTLTRDDLAAELSVIEADYRAVWLARNRPGGLQDSAARLHTAHELFQDT